MNLNMNEVISRNSIFAWIALAAGLILLIPFIAMQFTREVNWSAGDFVVMGLLLFAAGSVFVLLARKLPRKNRFVIGLVVAAVFFYLWAELAVGVFTDLGS